MRRAGVERSGVALVPTMGALHEGHLSHVERCRDWLSGGGGGGGEGEVWVSVFVNPTQFGRGEDLGRYPRDAERDAELCRGRGVDVLFMPSVGEMYREGTDWVGATGVEVPGLADDLEGLRRPGHFGGVCRVVLKLLNLVEAGAVTLGRKDYQQLRVVSAMIQDLDLPVEVLEVETTREADGLAMSSRNRYLSPAARPRAAAMAGAWRWAAAEVAGRGEVAAEELEAGMREGLERAGFEVDYTAVRDGRTLRAIGRVRSERVGSGRTGDGVQALKEARALLAARLEGVRLVDSGAVGVVARGG